MQFTQFDFRNNRINSIAGIEFSDEVMQNAVSITKKMENFINDCDNYVAGKVQASEIDENLLLTVSYRIDSYISTLISLLSFLFL